MTWFAELNDSDPAGAPVVRFPIDHPACSACLQDRILDLSGRCPGLWRVFSSAYLGDLWRRDVAINLVVIAWTTTAHTSIVMPTIFGYGPFISAALVSKAAKKNAIAIAVLTMMTDRLGLPTKVRGLHLCLPGRRLMGITTP